MVYATGLILYVLCYVAIQVVFLFCCCHVSQHRLRCLIILVSYTILFKGMDFLLQSPDPSAMSTGTYWTYWAVHTLDTFIMIFLMAVYADGTLGRNWVKIFFCYDIVSTGANMLMYNKLVLFLSKHHLVESASLYSASQPKDLLWITPWVYVASAVILAILILRKPLNCLVNKLPENLCLLLMGITFLTYILRVVILFLYQGHFFRFDERYPRNALLDMNTIMTILLLITLFLLIAGALQKRQLQHIQRLESAMLLDYYRNVSTLHGSIRRLRHDLSNHLAIPESDYHAALTDICERIDTHIRQQLTWQSIHTQQLSAREKYEIIHYLQETLQAAKLPPEAFCITEEKGMLRITLHTTKTLRPARLKTHSLFLVIRRIAVSHGARIRWIRSDGDCHLQLTGLTEKEN